MADRKSANTPGFDAGREPEFDPELEEDLGAEFELRGDTMHAQLEEAREEAARNLELAKRAQADFENYRKRREREFADERRRASQGLVEALLPVMDNLERAIDHATASAGARELLTGVEMVHQQLRDVLASVGVEAVDPFGAKFDPISHQAVGQHEDLEVPDHTVVEVYQKGYSMHGRVLRPAMVVVATGGPERTEE